MKRLFNFFRDHLSEYVLILLALAGVAYLAIAHGSYAEPGFDSRTAYVNKLFDQTYVHKIAIEIASDDFQNLLAEPREKIKYASNITIDGERFEDIAFSVRGNGSLVDVAKDDNSDRYSYTVNFRKFNKNGSYYGLDKLVLNNLYNDPSYLKNYLAFKLAAASGVTTPLTSFTELYINGELKGLYLAIESVDHAFLARTNASSDASIFHPIAHDIDNDRIYRETKSLSDGETELWTTDPGFQGADFKFIDNNPESYGAIFMNAVTKYSRSDEALIIDAIRSLDYNEMFNPPEDYWDIDSIINFFAAASFAPDTDSYLGFTSQNYYLKITDNKLSLIPWDHDRAFHADGSASAEGFDSEAILWPIDSPLIGSSEDERPLWRLIAENPDYLDRYHQTIQNTLNNYLFNGECRREFDAAVELIRPYVHADPTRFYSADEFEDEVEYLRRFIVLRADSIQKQLWGLIPRTRDDSESASYESLIVPDTQQENAL